MKPHLTSAAIICLILTATHCAAQLNHHKDTAYHSLKYRYATLSVFTGAGVSLNHINNGLLQVSFPYMFRLAADSTLRAGVFTSAPKDLNRSARLYLLPFGGQAGTNKHYFNAYFSLYSQGFSAMGGYGRIWNTPKGNTGKDEALFAKKWLVKSSLNLIYEELVFSSKHARLGTIDNSDRTVYALGHTSGVKFRTQGTDYNPPKTYSSKSLNVLYTQSELSLLPLVSFMTNPFRSRDTLKSPREYNAVRQTAGNVWEINIGYKINLSDVGGIKLQQDNGNGKGKNLDGFTHLDDPALTALYNSRPITKAPFRFSGFYASFIFQWSGSWLKRSHKKIPGRKPPGIYN